MNIKLPIKKMSLAMVCACISVAGICHEIERVDKSSGIKNSSFVVGPNSLNNTSLDKDGKVSIAAISVHEVNLAREIPDGFYEVVGFKSGNDKNIHFGDLAAQNNNLDKLKVLSNNYLLYSRWEDPKTQKYYPYSYSIFWEKKGDTLRWHIYMNHTGNAKTGHPSFRAYFETVGKLSGNHLENMSLVEDSESCLTLQKKAYGKAYDFNDITSRLAKSKHMAAYDKTVKWTETKKTNGFGTLYEFNEVNTAEDIATIAAQNAKEGEAVPIGFGSIRHLLVGNIHAQLTYVVQKVGQDYFEQSVEAGKIKKDCR